MAMIKNQITVGNLKIAVLDESPVLAPGIAMEIGSLAMVEGLSGLFQKTGPLDTDWKLSSVDAQDILAKLANHEGRLEVLETDPVTKSYVDSLNVAEIAARQAGDQNLQDNLDQEHSERVAADSTLQSNINSEAAARESADSALQSSLNSEISRAQAEETSIRSALSVETLTREATDNSLQSQINNILSNTDPSALDSLTEIVEAFQAADQNLNNAISSLGTGSSSALSQEILDRQLGDANLQSQLDAEITNRQNSDNSLNSKVDQEIADRQAAVLAEASARQAADAELQSNLDSEENARTMADMALQSNINTEAIARQSADNALQSNIDSEALARQNADGVLQSNIDSEASQRQSQDSILSGRIDQESLDRQMGDSALGSRIDQEIVDRQSADSTLQSNINAEASARSDADTAEQQAREAGDQALQSSLNSEIQRAMAAESSEESARKAADDALDVRLDALELDSVTKTYVDQKDAETLSSAKSYSDQKVADLVNSAPAVLDTLKELADAIGDDPNFAATVAGQVGEVQANLDQEIIDRQNAITAESNARSAADTTLQNNIDAEASARQSADNSEQQARIAGDQIIQDALNSEISRAMAAESSEASARQSADTALGGRIDQEISDRTAAVSAEATARIAADAALQSGLDTEVARAMAAEADLDGYAQDIRNDLDQEILNRASADSAEQARAMAAEALKLNKAGDTMSGDLDMGSNDVVNVGSLGLGTATPETIFEVVDGGTHYSVKGSSVSTSGASTAVAMSMTPGLNSVEHVKVMVMGFDSSSQDSVCYERTVKVKNSGGSVSLGVEQSDYTSEDSSLVSADCVIAVNGSAVEVRVVGVSGKSMNWKCLVQKMK